MWKYFMKKLIQLNAQQLKVQMNASYNLDRIVLDI